MLTAEEIKSLGWKESMDPKSPVPKFHIGGWMLYNHTERITIECANSANTFTGKCDNSHLLLLIMQMLEIDTYFRTKFKLDL